MMNNYSTKCEALHNSKKVVWLMTVRNHQRKTTGFHENCLNMQKENIHLRMQMTPNLVATLRRTDSNQGRVGCLAHIYHLRTTGVKPTPTWRV